MWLLPFRDRRTRTQRMADRAREVGNDIRSGARDLAADAREIAAEARPRLEGLGDQAEARWVSLRKQLADLEGEDLREDLLGRLEDEASRTAERAVKTSGAVGGAVGSLGHEAADATHHKLDKLGNAIETGADLAREQANEAPRKKRFWAILGVVAAGLIARYLLSQRSRGSNDLPPVRPVAAADSPAVGAPSTDGGEGDDVTDSDSVDRMSPPT